MNRRDQALDDRLVGVDAARGALNASSTHSSRRVEASLAP